MAGVKPHKRSSWPVTESQTDHKLSTSSCLNSLLEKQHLEVVAKDCAQATFEYLQGWRHHRVCASPPHSKKVFLDGQRSPPVFQFGPDASHSFITKRIPSVFFAPSLQLFIYILIRTPKPSLLQAEQSHLSAFPQERCSRLFMALFLITSSMSMSLFH